MKTRHEGELISTLSKAASSQESMKAPSELDSTGLRDNGLGPSVPVGVHLYWAMVILSLVIAQPSL